jgi:hypothetical protein
MTYFNRHQPSKGGAANRCQYIHAVGNIFRAHDPLALALAHAPLDQAVYYVPRNFARLDDRLRGSPDHQGVRGRFQGYRSCVHCLRHVGRNQDELKEASHEDARVYGERGQDFTKPNSHGFGNELKKTLRLSGAECGRRRKTLRLSEAMRSGGD